MEQSAAALAFGQEPWWAFLVAKVEELSTENQRLRTGLEAVKFEMQEKEEELQLAKVQLIQKDLRIVELNGAGEGDMIWAKEVLELKTILEAEIKQREKEAKKRQNLEEFVTQFCGHLTALVKQPELDLEDMEGNPEETEGDKEDYGDTVEGELKKLYKKVRDSFGLWTKTKKELQRKVAEMSGEGKGNQKPPNSREQGPEKTPPEGLLSVKAVEVVEITSESEDDGECVLKIVETHSLQRPAVPAQIARKKQSVRKVREIRTQARERKRRHASLADVVVNRTRPKSKTNLFTGGLGDREFPQCTQCNQRFASKNSLISHQNRIHSDKLVYLACPLCGEKFWDKLLLVGHIASSHNEGKRRHAGRPGFFCPFCVDRKFGTKQNLKNHVANSHKDRIQ